LPSNPSCTVKVSPSAANRYLSLVVAAVPLLLAMSLLKPMAAPPYLLAGWSLLLSALLLVLLLRLKRRSAFQLTVYASGEIRIVEQSGQVQRAAITRLRWRGKFGVLIGIRNPENRQLSWLWLAHDAMSQREFRHLCRMLIELR